MLVAVYIKGDVLEKPWESCDLVAVHGLWKVFGVICILTCDPAVSIGSHELKGVNQLTPM